MYYRVQQFYSVPIVVNVIKKDFVKLLISNYASSELPHSSGTYPEKPAKQLQMPRKLKPSVLGTHTWSPYVGKIGLSFVYYNQLLCNT